MSRSNRQRGSYKFPNRRPERDISVEDIKRSLGLIDAAPPSRWEEMNDQESYDEPCQRGAEQHPAGVSTTPVPSRYSLDQSIANRKHTSASFDNTTISTERTRNSRSSRNTDRQ